MLRRVLREDWGFRGWVMSDYGATHSTVPAALAGMDQEQPAGVPYADSLKLAIRHGEVPLATLAKMCSRILRTVVGLGLIGRDESPRLAPAEIAAHRGSACAVAEEGTVLLKNSGKVRPAHAVSLIEGIRQRLGPEAEVVYTQGCDPISAADLLAGEESIPSTFFRLPDGTDHVVQAEFWPNRHPYGPQ